MYGSDKQLKVESTNPAVKKYQVVFVYLVLAASTIAVYWPVRNFAFLNYDDTKYVSQNPYVNSGITRQGLVWAFTDSIGYWHPVTWLSHMLDCQLFGVNSGSHHLVNLAFHTASALLLFTILWQMTFAFWRSAFVAAVFALHPLRVESVAWIVERKDVLSSFFWMLVILAYLKYVNRRSILFYLSSLFFFALALMTKPTVVTLGFVLLLLDYWPLNRFGSLSSGASRKIFYRLLIEKIPFFILSAAAIYLSSTSSERLNIAISFKAVPMTLRIANATVSYVKYTGMMVWPEGLAAFYPYPSSIPVWQSIGALSLLLLLAIFMFRTSKTRPYVLVGSLWFFGTLLPSIGLLQAGLWPAVADRFTYLPSVGIFIITAWVSYDLLKKYKHKNPVLMLAAVIILAALFIATRVQLGYWRDSTSLFERTLSVTKDNYVAHHGLAYELQEQGKKDEAMAHYLETLRIEPNYAEAHINLGIAFASKGQLDEAERYLIRALQINPSMAAAHSSLAKLYTQEGKNDLAIVYYQRTLEIEPLNADAHNLLGQALVEQGSFDKAIEHLTKAVQLDPKAFTAHFYLARALSEHKQYSQAVMHLREALKLKPDWPAAMNSLAWFLATYRGYDFYQPEEAVNFGRRACEMTNYDNAGFMDTLAAAYAATGNFKEAVAMADKALHLADQNEKLSDEIRNRRQLFKDSQPYIEKP